MKDDKIMASYVHISSTNAKQHLVFVYILSQSRRYILVKCEIYCTNIAHDISVYLKWQHGDV